ncbi:hypothetical protein DdX_15726 [Ditylenchus destructor]|uniref:Uncharacterized protein n=1 Tax=Ditylenchus destructor TaxID=166010 RepID=A0AAD4MPU5_9BILA|nr:hypothetical protein DdX_15726 [Ditylenchus destructor]
MSSSTKRSQKSRQSQSEDEKKAQREKNAQRMRERRAAQKKSKLEDLKLLDPLPLSQVSSMDESSSLGADDSGFVKNFREENEQGSNEEQVPQLDIGDLDDECVNCGALFFKSEHVSGEKKDRQQSPTKQTLPLRSSSPGDDSQCGDDSSLQHNVGLLHSMNRFIFSCSVMQLRHAIFLIALISPENTKKKRFLCALQVPAMTRNVGMIRHFDTTWDFYIQRISLLNSDFYDILSTETIMDFSSCDVDLMVLQHSDGVAL